MLADKSGRIEWTEETDPVSLRFASLYEITDLSK